jgi:hypothetical protein
VLLVVDSFRPRDREPKAVPTPAPSSPGTDVS